MEILEDQKLLPTFNPKIDDIILAFSEELRPVANKLAMDLRLRGRAIEIVLGEGKKLKWAYSYADRLGADRSTSPHFSYHLRASACTHLFLAGCCSSLPTSGRTARSELRT